MPAKLNSPMLCFLAAAIAASSVGGAKVNGGARGAVSQKFLDYAVGQAMPLIEQSLLHEKFDDIKGKSGHIDYSVTDIKVSKFKISSPKLAFIKDKGLKISLSGISIAGSMHWKWKETKWPHPSGSGTADFSVGGSTHGTGLIELTTAKGRPHANLEDADVSLDHFSIKIHHSALSWLYDVIFDAFEHTIKKSMEKSIQDAMKDAIDDDLNKEFATMPLSTPIPFEAPFDVAELRYDFLDIETKNDHIAVTIRGSVNDTDAKRPSYPSPPPHLPASNASIYGHHHLTMQLSTYSLDSAMYVFYNRGLLSYEVTQKDLDSKTGFLLNTDTFLLAAPGLKQWPDHNMTIVASIAQLPKTRFEADQILANIPAMYAFYVVTDSGKVPVFNITGPIAAAASVSVSLDKAGEQTIHASITNATCTPLVVNSTAVGPVHFDLVSQVIEYSLDAMVPIVNYLIAEGVPLPGYQGVEATKTGISAAGDVLTVVSDVKYAPSL